MHLFGGLYGNMQGLAESHLTRLGLVQFVEKQSVQMHRYVDKQLVE